MENNPTWLLVVAALIRDESGRLLLQQGLPGKPHAGQWEFPGGKVESEENPRLALQREVAEELGVAVDIASMEPAGFADESAHGAKRSIVLILYECVSWTGQPQSLEGQQWGWFAPADAAGLPMAPMDRTLLAALVG